MHRSKYLAVLLLVAFLVTGCKTFRTERVCNEREPFRGIPTLVYKTHVLTVQWKMGPKGYSEGASGAKGTEVPLNAAPGDGGSDPLAGGGATKTSVAFQDADTPNQEEIFITQHFCRLPVMYAVDPIGTPVGKDNGTIELNADGSMKKATEERDHQVDELITAVGDAVNTLNGRTEGGLAPENPFDFYPPLPKGAIILSIEGLPGTGEL